MNFCFDDIDPQKRIVGGVVCDSLQESSSIRWEENLWLVAAKREDIQLKTIGINLSQLNSKHLSHTCASVTIVDIIMAKKVLVKISRSAGVG